MGYSRSDPHRPCLRRHSYGGSEVWFTNSPESEGGFDTLDVDMGKAIANLRRLAGGSAANDMPSKGKERP